MWRFTEKAWNNSTTGWSLLKVAHGETDEDQDQSMRHKGWLDYLVLFLTFVQRIWWRRVGIIDGPNDSLPFAWTVATTKALHLAGEDFWRVHAVPVADQLIAHGGPFVCLRMTCATADVFVSVFCNSRNTRSLLSRSRCDRCGETVTVHHDSMLKLSLGPNGPMTFSSLNWVFVKYSRCSLSLLPFCGSSDLIERPLIWFLVVSLSMRDCVFSSQWRR